MNSINPKITRKLIVEDSIKSTEAAQDPPEWIMKKNPHIKVWPLFSLAFIKTMYISIFALAFKNYLDLQLEWDPSLVGVIISSQPIAYIAAPFLGSLITRKMKNFRYALLISSILSVILLGIESSVFIPEVLITVRILDGLSNGLLWPNLFRQLSEWQKVSGLHQSERNFKIFNNSWSLGLCAGYLAGFFLVLDPAWGNSLLAMKIGFALTFVNLPICIYYLKSSRDEQKAYSMNNDDYNLEEQPRPPTKTYFPILYSWFGMLIVSVVKSTFNNSYQYFIYSEISYFTFIAILVLQLAQIGGINYITPKKPRFKHIRVILSILIITVLSIGSIFISFYKDSIGIYAGIFQGLIIGTIGFFIGIAHGTSQKIMINFTSKTDSSKYTVINEILVGIGFGITPMITGFLVEIQLSTVFIFLISFNILILIVLSVLSKKVDR
jgi:MFS family permease